MIVKPSKACGKVMAPPSKSMAHRNLICAALAEGDSVVKNIDLSQDIKATLECITQLGAEARIEGNTIYVKGSSDFTSIHQRVFNCNESGSTLRFFIPLSMISGEKCRFTGSEVLMTRPLSVYEKICSEQNILLEHKNGGIEVEGKLKGGKFEVPGNISSQFITGLLFTLPLLKEDSTIVLTESVESKPYIDMTLEVQKEFGIDAQWINENTLKINGNQKYRNCVSTVEGDYSNAAFFEALNTISGKVETEGLKKESLQGDKVYLPYFEALKKDFCSLDISDCPDLGPILFVVASLNHGAEFTGTRRLKIKESNRGAVMCEELAKFGVKTLQEENRIVIYKSEIHSPEEVISGHNDHRIVMSFVTLLSVTGGKIEGVGAVKKSFPDYFKRIKKLGIDFEFENQGESNGLV